jgi:hypothetical protein
MGTGSGRPYRIPQNMTCQPVPVLIFSQPLIAQMVARHAWRGFRPNWHRFEEGRRNLILAAVCQDKRRLLECNWEAWAKRAEYAAMLESAKIQSEELAIPQADVIEYVIWTAKQI